MPSETAQRRRQGKADPGPRRLPWRGGATMKVIVQDDDGAVLATLELTPDEWDDATAHSTRSWELLARLDRQFSDEPVEGETAEWSRAPTTEWPTTRRYKGWTLGLGPERVKCAGLREPPPDVPGSLPDERTPSHRERFITLRSREDYPTIRKLLGRYVQETIPDPLHSTGFWVVTAFPSDGVAFRLSVGWTETLFTRAASGETYLFLSADGDFPERFPDIAAQVGIDAELCEGPSLEVSERLPFYEVACGSPADGVRLLTDPDVLDAAYRLNARMMGYQSPLHARNNNWLLVRDVLAAAWEEASVAVHDR